MVQPKESSSTLPQRESPPEGPSPELDSEDSESLYATDGDMHPRDQSLSTDPLNTVGDKTVPMFFTFEKNFLYYWK